MNIRDQSRPPPALANFAKLVGRCFVWLSWTTQSRSTTNEVTGYSDAKHPPNPRGYSMKSAALKNSRTSAISCVIAALLTVISDTTVAQDIALDFHFLKLGLSRKAVVKLLGKPKAETESQTLAIKYRRLTWIDPEGQKYSAAFILDRLFRWKTCSAAVVDC